MPAEAGVACRNFAWENGGAQARSKRGGRKKSRQRRLVRGRPLIRRPIANLPWAA
jgi:hypothetical protein